MGFSLGVIEIDGSNDGFKLGSDDDSTDGTVVGLVDG